MSQEITLSTMLSFKRSISQGRAVMYACSDMEGANPEPLQVQEAGIRAVKGHDVYARDAKEKKNDPNSLINHIQKAIQPNPQRTEQLFMPESKPVLKVEFMVKYLGLSKEPFLCNSADLMGIMQTVVRKFADKGGFEGLGQRYVTPLVTGRWMWRNNDEAMKKRIVITVMYPTEEVFEFKPKYGAFTLDKLTEQEQADAKRLGEMIGKSMASQSDPLFITVTAYYYMGPGVLAFCSQEMITEREEGAPSRTLYKISDNGVRNQAGFHEQKLGNALRCIDDSHGDERFGALAVETLGVVSTHQLSVRVPTKRDFYSLCKANLVMWRDELLSDKPLSEITEVDDLSYVVAVLVRGGAFV
ncbi:type I-F CRISPR-associated protein Csy3 [Pseudomonas aeruginosa]